MKKLLTAMVVVLFLLALAGCSESADSPLAPEETPSLVDVTPEPLPTPALTSPIIEPEPIAAYEILDVQETVRPVTYMAPEFLDEDPIEQQHYFRQVTVLVKNTGNVPLLITGGMIDLDSEDVWGFGDVLTPQGNILHPEETMRLYGASRFFEHIPHSLALDNTIINLHVDAADEILVQTMDDLLVQNLVLTLEDGFFHARGQLYNRGSYPVRGAAVVVSLFDAESRFLDHLQIGIGREAVLYPGESLDFHAQEWETPSGPLFALANVLGLTAEDVYDQAVPTIWDIQAGFGGVIQVQNEIALDYDAVIQSLAGVWNWPGGLGNPLSIFNDGTWEQEPGSVGLYGDVHMTESNGIFLLEFIVTRAEGPGAYGWIPEGETTPAAGTEYGWRSGDVWARGVYAPTSNKLLFENWDGSMLQMERNS